MKRRLLFTLLLVGLCRMAWGYDFSVAMSDGKVLYFSILSADDHTAVVVSPGLGQQGDLSGVLAIPSVVSHEGVDYDVVAVGRQAFALCEGLTVVVVPTGVRTIGTLAFMGCTSLDSIQLPSTLDSIAVDAFNGTAYLSNTSHWSDSNRMLYIGSYLIKARSNVGSVVAVRDGTLGIAGAALYQCDAIDSLSLPASLLFVGPYAFASCDSLRVVHLGGSVPPRLASDAFYNDDAVLVEVPCGALAAYQEAEYWGGLMLEGYGCDSGDVQPPTPTDSTTIFPFPIPIPTPKPDGPLVIIVDSTQLAIDGVGEAKEVNLRVVDERLTLSGVAGHWLTVCDIAGRVVLSQRCAADVVGIRLRRGGLYVVAIDGKVYRKVSI